MVGNKPGPAPKFGKAMSGAERQRLYRNARAVEQASRIAELEAKVRDLEAQLAATPSTDAQEAVDPLAGGSVAVAGEIVRRLGKRKAAEVARRILAPVSAPPR
jgi:hypothetical protein